MAKKINIDTDIFKTMIENKHTTKELCAFFNASRAFINRLAIKLNLKISRPQGRKLSDDVKKDMSVKRKLWLKDNPDKHPWKKSTKFKSVPCENVKTYFQEFNIPFIEEFDPEIPTRNFSIDIAIPDKKIAIEINGNQHYNRDGQLKPYYKERNDLLIENGWEVYQIHYTCCFDKKFWKIQADRILNKEKINEFNYELYTKKPTIFLCTCGVEICRNSIRCKKCSDKNRRPHKNKPNKEVLEQLHNTIPRTAIGKKFGVSDNCIKKWLQSYDIVLENRRGYWAKKYSEMASQA